MKREQKPWYDLEENQTPEKLVEYIKLAERRLPQVEQYVPDESKQILKELKRLKKEKKLNKLPKKRIGDALYVLMDVEKRARANDLLKITNGEESFISKIKYWLVACKARLRWLE